MRNFIVILLIIFSYGCNTPQQKVKLEPGRLITYAIPYPGWLRFSTRFTLPNGQEAIAFFNTQTYKRLDVFTLDGRHVKTISLKELCEFAPHINDISALNSDSFVALGEIHNNIYFFNAAGKVFQHTHINDSVQGKPDWTMELSSSIYDGFVQDDSTLLFRSWFATRASNKLIPYEQRIRMDDSVSRLHPFFVAVRITPSSAYSVQYSLPSFYNRFLPKDASSGELPFYTITPKNILLFSSYCDSVYVLNKQTYNMEGIIKVKSAFSKAGEPISFDHFHETNDYLQTNGSIMSTYYDEYRDLYYVSVRHGISLNTTSAERRHNRKWSLLVYNKAFKLLDEINIDPKYCPGEMLITREGIMLSLDDYEIPNVPTQFQLFYVHQK